MPKALIETCSETVKRCLEYIDLMLIQDERNYHCNNSLIFFLLGKLNNQYVVDFISHSQSDNFWLDNSGYDCINYAEGSDVMYYLSKLGLHEEISEEYNYMKSQQTINGEIHSNTFNHTGALRILSLLEPDSSATVNAVNFFLSN